MSNSWFLALLFLYRLLKAANNNGNAQAKKIWNSSITRNKKLRIYKAYVQSIMLFGCSMWAMDKGMVRSVDSFNRKMVRYVCGVFWPNRMKTETMNDLIEPASQIVTRQPWQMLGHILRMDDLVPVKQSTINCFKKKTQCGRFSTSLLTTIKHDLKAHKLNLDQAVELVQDRDLWKLEGSRTPANKDLLKYLNTQFYLYFCLFVNPNK